MFSKFILFVFLTAWLSIPGFLCADSEPRMNLDALIQELLIANPEIQAAGIRYQAALTRPAAEGALPDPRISIGWMSAGTILPGGKIGEDPNANLGLQLSQEFPYPGKRHLKTEIARKEAESVRESSSLTIRNRIAALKTAYHELTYIYEALGLLHENQNTLRAISQVAEARYSAGKGMQQDLIRSGTEVAVLQNRILLLEQRKKSLSAEINILLDRPATTSLGRPVKITIPELEPYERLLAEAKQNSPLLKAERAMTETRNLGVKLAKKEFYPDLEVMTGYYYQGDMDDMWEVRAGISIPIFFRSKQKKQLEEASLNLSEAKKNYRAAEQMLEYRLRDAYVKAEASRNLTELYSTQVVPQSQLAFESSLVSYETGGVDFLTVLTNFTAILEYQMNHYEQETEYFKALANLEELAGGTFAGLEVEL